jgi:hypothetical protein
MIGPCLQRVNCCPCIITLVVVQTVAVLFLLVGVLATGPRLRTVLLVRGTGKSAMWGGTRALPLRVRIIITSDQFELFRNTKIKAFAYFNPLTIP